MFKFHYFLYQIQMVKLYLLQLLNIKFEPESNFFGFSASWPSFGNPIRITFTEDKLNTFQGAFPTQSRVYPYKDESGLIINNTYIIAFEDGYLPDYNDLVIIVHNVYAI